MLHILLYEKQKAEELRILLSKKGLFYSFKTALCDINDSYYGVDRSQTHKKSKNNNFVGMLKIIVFLINLWRNLHWH